MKGVLCTVISALSLQVYEGCRGCSWCWIIFTSVYPDPHALSWIIKTAVKHKFWQKAAMSCCAGLSWYLCSPYPYLCFVSRYFLSLCGTVSSLLSVLKLSEPICISWTCRQQGESNNSCRFPSRNKTCILSVTLICNSEIFKWTVD